MDNRSSQHIFIMATIKIKKQYEDYTGPMPPASNKFYITNRYGVKKVSHYPIHKDPSVITEKQRASSRELALAAKAADADLADPVKHDEWLKRRNADIESWNKQKTLRGYVIAQYRKKMTTNT